MSNYSFYKNNINEIKKILSIDRYNTYYNLAGKDDIKALHLYRDNIHLSQKFYALLHILEVCLRNKINNVLETKYGSGWISSKKLIFTSAQRNIISDLAGVEQKKIIPMLPFGFWTSFFNKAFEEMWRHDLRVIFDVRKIRRGEVAQCLKSVRQLRNRIAHHEPIINLELHSYEATCYWLIQMMSQASLQWLKTDILKDNKQEESK